VLFCVIGKMGLPSKELKEWDSIVRLFIRLVYLFPIFPLISLIWIVPEMGLCI
jgi:hypothetical protein